MNRIFSLLVLLGLLSTPAFGEPMATFRPGDVFEMRLSGVPAEDAQQFALQYTVGPDGTINVPLVGEVKAAGLSATLLERALQGRLVARKIFTQPTVIINPVQGIRTVSVSGGVKMPQRLPWTGDLTLLSAVGACGGLSEFGKSSGVRVVREFKVIGVYNLKEIDRDPSRDQKLLPGDQVLVRE